MTLPEHYAIWSRSHHLMRAALLFYWVWINLPILRQGRIR